jgi:hypothetical protein
MKITAAALTVALLIANAQCLLACETPPRQSQSHCHPRQPSGPAHTAQPCAHPLVFDVAPSPAKADLVRTGVSALAAAQNVDLTTQQFVSGRLCIEASPPLSRQLCLSTVLKI